MGRKAVQVVEETAVDGYTTEIIGNALSGFEIRNAHTPETVIITGSKTWDDANDQDGMRPDEITIRLHADGNAIRTATVTAEDDWTWNFTDLPKYADGNEIAYTVTEDAISEYSASYSGYDVTNSYTPGQTSLTVVKTWDDNDDQDGLRPDSVEVSLLKNGEETGQTITLSESNNWEDSFTELDEYTAGIRNVYTVEEASVNGYTAEITGNESMGYEIINTHTPETMSIRGSKIWNDNDDQAGKRPESITVNLLADGETVNSIIVSADADENWTYTFTDLPGYRAHGVKINYTIEETAVPEYNVEYDGYDVINTYETYDTETISIPVEKIWEDDDNEYGYRPDSIDVALLADGEETGLILTLNEENDWSGVFEDLVKTDAGEEIEYTIQEISDETLQYYASQISGDAETGFTIVNQREYFDIDEEIVVEEDNRSSWVKNESVNEYNAIEIGLSTILPIIEPDELSNGKFTMNFHEILESQLVLDENDADILVYLYRSNTEETGISGLSAVNALADGSNREKVDYQYYTVTISPDDGCSFHVDVDLTAMYLDGVVTDEDLLGGTEIMIFFYADLEGTGLNGSYKFTAWYDVYNGDNLKYTSNEDVVEVYTFEISVLKYDADALKDDDYEGASLAGATMGLFYDAAGENPVIRNGEPYTVTTGGDGLAVFYGLVEGTYYVTELEAPEGYERSDQVIEATVNRNMGGYIYEALFANDPVQKDAPRTPEKTVNVGDGATVVVGEELIYTIAYYNNSNETEKVVITDTLDSGLEFASASDDGEYDDSSRTVTWTIEALASDEGSVDVAVTIGESAATEGKVENTAGVQIGNAETVDTNTVENPVELKITPEPTPEPDEPKDPVKSVNIGEETEVTVGEELTYTVTYYNNYNETVEVVITDALDSGVDFVSATNGGVYDVDSHTVTWTIEDVEMFTSGSVDLTVVITADAERASGVSNTASVQIGNAETVDTNTVNNPLALDENTPDTGTPDNGNPKSGNNGNDGNSGKTSPQTDGPVSVGTMVAMAVVVLAFGGSALFGGLSYRGRRKKPRARK